MIDIDHDLMTPPPDRDAIRAARLRRWRADCLRLGAEPLVLIARRPDGSLDVLASEDLPTMEVVDLCWLASTLVLDQAREAADPSRLESNDAGNLGKSVKSGAETDRQGIPRGDSR